MHISWLTTEILEYNIASDTESSQILSKALKSFHTTKFFFCIFLLEIGIFLHLALTNHSYTISLMPFFSGLSNFLFTEPSIVCPTFPYFNFGLLRFINLSVLDAGLCDDRFETLTMTFAFFCFRV
jgi:hypothetical protein